MTGNLPPDRQPRSLPTDLSTELVDSPNVGSPAPPESMCADSKMSDEAGMASQSPPVSVALEPVESAARKVRGARSLARGTQVLGGGVGRLPLSPGVYRMLDDEGNALYVGKARSLKKGVANYANPANLSNRLRR